MATTRISRDSLDSERRARIIGEDQHKGAIRARTRELLRLDAGRGGGGRRQAPATPAPGVRRGGGKGASREAVLKIVSWTKDSTSPMAQARYASRTRQSDPPNAGLVMVNEEGRALRGVQIEGEIRSWDLKSEADNQSAAARRATPAERRPMPAAERLDKRQAVHRRLPRDRSSMPSTPSLSSLSVFACASSTPRRRTPIGIERLQRRCAIHRNFLVDRHHERIESPI
jgi:hypothetical protein